MDGRSGITKGCNPPANTRFCPDATVTRGQTGCLTAATQPLTDFLTGHDPNWNDGCPP